MKAIRHFQVKAFKRILMTLLCALFAARGYGADTGGSLSPFDLGGSAKVAAMGGAAAAVPGDGEGFFTNPAVLANPEEHEILTLHALLLQDTLYDSVAYLQPLAARQGVGAAFTRLGTSGLSKTVDNVQTIADFSWEEWQGLLGYGFQALDGLDVGASVKYIREQLDVYQGSGFGMDVGALYRLLGKGGNSGQAGPPDVTAGFAISNFIGPQVKLYQTADQPALVYRPSLSLFYPLPSSPDALSLVVEGEILERGDIFLKGGAEYAWNKTIVGRAGFDGVGLTAGVGLRLSGFELDYAFRARDLGSLNLFSLAYRFDRYQEPLQAQRMEILKWTAREYNRSGDLSSAIKAYQKCLEEFPEDRETAQSLQDLQKLRQGTVGRQLGAAKTSVANGDLAKALSALAKVLGLDPENAEAKGLLRKLDQKTLVSNNYTRGVEAYGRGDYAGAAQYLRLVRETDPHYRNVDFLYREAENRSRPLESMPKELAVLYAKGVDAYLNGDYPKAIEIWGRVLEKDPRNFLVNRNIEDARARLREKESPKPAVPPRGETGGAP